MSIYCWGRLESYWNKMMEQNLGRVMGEWSGFGLDCCNYQSICGGKNILAL